MLKPPKSGNDVRHCDKFKGCKAKCRNLWGIFTWFWTKIGGFSAFCPKKACLSIQLKAKNVKKRITC